MWNTYNVANPGGGSYITMVASNSPDVDAVMWATATYSPAATPNFVLKIKALIPLSATIGANPELSATQAYTIFFADSTSRVIPATNGVVGQEYGVDWASFTGLAILCGGVADIYSFYTSTPGEFGYSWPKCNGPGSRSGEEGCFNWAKMIRGNIHYLIVAVEDARYVRVTICANGVSPCQAVQGYDYFLESPLTDLTGPVYFGIAARNNELSGTSYFNIYSIDFYTPTVSCPSNCNGRGFCMNDGSCICHSGYSGANCGSFSCSPSCSNGGTCTDAKKCQCPPGFGGSSCTNGKSHRYF